MFLNDLFSHSYKHDLNVQKPALFHALDWGLLHLRKDFPSNAAVCKWLKNTKQSPKIVCHVKLLHASITLANVHMYLYQNTQVNRQADQLTVPKVFRAHWNLSFNHSRFNTVLNLKNMQGGHNLKMRDGQLLKGFLLLSLF